MYCKVPSGMQFPKQILGIMRLVMTLAPEMKSAALLFTRSFYWV